MYKEIIIQSDFKEITAAVLEDNKVAELYFNRTRQERLAGNIYQGKVSNVLPGMQAAFIDIGLEKNAFLYVEDALPAGYEENGENSSFRNFARPSISDVLKEGQQLMVQIIKEPFGTKGPRVTTNITLPGRYVVLMPGTDYIGISRRIEEEAERNRLKSLAQSFKPDGVGAIIRTAALEAGENDFQEDFRTLNLLWKRIQSRIYRNQAPALIHKDLELVQRVLRDLFSADVDRLVVNCRELYQEVMEFIDLVMPQFKNRVVLKETNDLLSLYNISTQIEQALRHKVWLDCGGYLVIDQVEALTAIDVNTGKFVGTTSLADTVLKVNLQAAKEIARQLRLRNIGGIVIIDFIDMHEQVHREQVLEQLETQLKKDKTKTHILGITQLGLVEMTRKKTRQGLENVLLKDCPYCQGKGKVLNEETISVRAKRQIAEVAGRTDAQAVLVEVNPSIASILIGSGGTSLKQLEERVEKQLIIRGMANLHLEDIRIRPLDNEKEVEQVSRPVETGQIVKIKVDEPQTGNLRDGIARIEGYVIDIEDGGALVGQEVLVEVTKVFRTYAKAKPLV